ncbi:MAG: hypothetical protein JW718_10470 [Desulfovibrionaceae bacterium]|nr:hypothetical protein [Desulfovibrionaceae bacterium]
MPQFDPELLYVECGRCGRPVIWRPGDTTRILEAAGVDLSQLDEGCLLVTEGCPECSPEQKTYSSQVVRFNQPLEDRPKPPNP